jgi:hypothetical protein
MAQASRSTSLNDSLGVPFVVVNLAPRTADLSRPRSTRASPHHNIHDALSDARLHSLIHPRTSLID